MNFPVFIFHVWDAAELFSVFPVQRGEDHSDKSRGGSVSLKIKPIPLLYGKGIHLRQRFRFFIIRADMQALNAKSLIIGQEFRLGKILFLFAVASCTAQSNASGVTNSGSRIMDVHSNVSLCA